MDDTTCYSVSDSAHSKAWSGMSVLVLCWDLQGMVRQLHGGCSGSLLVLAAALQGCKPAALLAHTGSAAARLTTPFPVMIWARVPGRLSDIKHSTNLESLHKLPNHLGSSIMGVSHGGVCSPSRLLAPAVGAAKLQRLAPVQASSAAFSARAGARRIR